MAITKYKTGAIRDKRQGKPNFLECMSPFAMWRYGEYMAKKAEKYGTGNWIKGIPQEDYLESAERHLLQLKMDFKYGYIMEHSEHAEAVLFNIMGFIHEAEMKRLGLRHKEN